MEDRGWRDGKLKIGNWKFETGKVEIGNWRDQ
jgi:hypothetical protein